MNTKGNLRSIAFALAGLGGIVLASSIALRTIGLLCMSIPPGPYNAELAEKDGLPAQFPVPRVFLVGGSNLAFGVDSVRLSKSLSRPVVNMGLQYGLGLAFMFKQIEPHLARSDTVIIIPEYLLFIGSASGDPECLADALLIWPPCARHMRSASQIRNLLEGLVTVRYSWLAERIRVTASRLLQVKQDASIQERYEYACGGFNAHGDEVRHLAFPDGPDKERLSSWLWPDSTYDPTGARLINEFAERVRPRGVRVAIVFPPYPRTTYEDNRIFLDNLALKLRSSLAIPILDTLQDGLAPTNHIFNMCYHLNAAGIAARSCHLESILHRFLSSNDSGTSFGE